MVGVMPCVAHQSRLLESLTPLSNEKEVCEKNLCVPQKNGLQSTRKAKMQMNQQCNTLKHHRDTLASGIHDRTPQHILRKDVNECREQTTLLVRVESPDRTKLVFRKLLSGFLILAQTIFCDGRKKNNVFLRSVTENIEGQEKQRKNQESYKTQARKNVHRLEVSWRES